MPRDSASSSPSNVQAGLTKGIAVACGVVLAGVTAGQREGCRACGHSMGIRCAESSQSCNSKPAWTWRAYPPTRPRHASSHATEVRRGSSPNALAPSEREHLHLDHERVYGAHPKQTRSTFGMPPDVPTESASLVSRRADAMSSRITADWIPKQQLREETRSEYEGQDKGAAPCVE
jgi:hypothetical protein